MTDHAAAPNRSQRWLTTLDGHRLRQLRRQAGLSQADLAARAGISLTAMARLDLLTEQDREFPQFSGWVAGSGGTFSGHDRRW
jgi:DNA-binding XRE family transcriptional regulator